MVCSIFIYKAHEEEKMSTNNNEYEVYIERNDNNVKIIIPVNDVVPAESIHYVAKALDKPDICGSTIYMPTTMMYPGIGISTMCLCVDVKVPVNKLAETSATAISEFITDFGSSKLGTKNAKYQPTQHQVKTSLSSATAIPNPVATSKQHQVSQTPQAQKKQNPNTFQGNVKKQLSHGTILSNFYSDLGICDVASSMFYSDAFNKLQQQFIVAYAQGVAGLIPETDVSKHAVAAKIAYNIFAENADHRDPENCNVCNRKGDCALETMFFGYLDFMLDDINDEGDVDDNGPAE